MVRYLHAAAGFPTEATWYDAVKSGNYNSWPWLNPKNVRAHFPESEETQKGHMRNERQGLRSTRKRAKRRNDVDSDNANRTECPSNIHHAKHQDVFMCTFNLKNEMESKIYDQLKEKIYSD